MSHTHTHAFINLLVVTHRVIIIIIILVYSQHFQMPLNHQIRPLCTTSSFPMQSEVVALPFAVVTFEPCSKSKLDYNKLVIFIIQIKHILKYLYVQYFI